jgi:CO dehydrogenase maturation factor
VKLAVSGKGGVGKTTIAATLSRLLARDGFRVLAIDADPAESLSFALGIPGPIRKTIVPLMEDELLIEERTGARPGEIGGIFSLTPRVDDLAEKFGVPGPDGTRLLVMGTVKSAGSGCMCPSNSLLRALLRHIFLTSTDAVVMDMEAGLEHLGRGTIRGIDALINVVEPRTQSVEISARITELAKQLQVKHVLAVGNKVRDINEKTFLERGVNGIGLPLIGTVPYDEMIIRADWAGMPPLDFAPNCNGIQAIKQIEVKLLEMFK